MKLGANSVLFQSFDFPTACRHMALAGYDGVEISAIKGMCEHSRSTAGVPRPKSIRHRPRRTAWPFCRWRWRRSTRRAC